MPNSVRLLKYLYILISLYLISFILQQPTTNNQQPVINPPVLAQEVSPTPTPTIIPVVTGDFDIFNFGITLDIIDREATDSDILSLVATAPGALVRSTVAYDEKMYAVSNYCPVLTYRTKPTMPVIRYGITPVNVTTLGGNIEIGDYITSSPIPGKGQKAGASSGFVLGVAMEQFNDKSGIEYEYEKQKLRAGKILVTVGIGPASPVKVQAMGGIFGTFRLMMAALLYNLQSTKQLAQIIRYILAALVAVSALVISFLTFGRNINKGIESIGRNPLAKVPIQSMIVLNIVLIALVTIGAVVLSLIIISI